MINRYTIGALVVGFLLGCFLCKSRCGSTSRAVVPSGTRSTSLGGITTSLASALTTTTTTTRTTPTSAPVATTLTAPRYATSGTTGTVTNQPHPLRRSTEELI